MLKLFTYTTSFLFLVKILKAKHTIQACKKVYIKTNGPFLRILSSIYFSPIVSKYLE